MSGDVMTADRRRILALFTLAGADLGVLLAMLCFAEAGTGRTEIGVGATLVLGGGVAGGWAGAALARLTSTRPRAARWAVGSGVLLLTTLLGSSLGWLAGAFEARNAWEHDTLTRRGVLLGCLIGPPVGLLVLAPQWLRRPGS